jgi:putative ABC transport system permease protein
MSRPVPGPLERVGAALFRGALALLPAWLRDRAGDEMVAVFVERHRAAAPRMWWRAWLVEFGGLARTALRARLGAAPARESSSTHRGSFIDRLVLDLRFALRALVRRPTTAALAGLTLALGIAASTAMFSVVDAVLLRPLPFPDAHEIVALYPTNPGFEGHPTLGDAAVRGTFSYPEFRELRDNAGGVLEAVSIVVPWGSTILAPDDGPAERVSVGSASASLFTEVLRVAPLLGRAFLPDEDETQGFVLLTEAFWQRRYGGDPEIVGRVIDLGGTHEVIGVLSSATVLPGAENVEAWVMISPQENRGDHSFFAVGRLADGVSVEQARERLSGALAAAAPPGEGHDHAVSVFLQAEEDVRSVKGPLTMLAAAAALLLLVACGNVAVLLLGSAIDREREFAVRGALGAARGRLVQQLLTESLVLAGVAAVAGIALTRLATDALVLLAPDDVPRIASAAIDLRALGFGVAVALGCGVLFGLVPALFSSGGDSGVARSGSRGGTNSGRARLQGVLVVCELALATVLLVGAGLLGRTVLALDAVDTGFDVDRLVAVHVAIPFERLLSGVDDVDERSSLVRGAYDEVMQAVLAVPGVEDAAWTSTMPLTSERGNNDIEPEGYEGADLIAERRFVSGNFFDVMGMEMVEGRAFTTADDRPGGAPVMIVSEGVARAAWPNESAIGKRVTYWEREMTVIGVAPTVRDEGVRAGTEFAFYVPRLQAGRAWGNLVVRARAEPLSLAPSIREAIWAVDRGIAVPSIRGFSEHFAAEIASERYRARLVLVFSGLSALFALMGVYGVTARSVAARTRELGIRVALGAERASVMGLVFKQALRMAIYGGLAGLVAAWFVTRALEGYLWGVEPTDPLTIVGTAFLLAAASVVAALAPGRRAARVDPIEALRAE